MFDKIKDMKVAKKLKFSFTLVVIIASISSILGLIVLSNLTSIDLLQIIRIPVLTFLNWAGMMLAGIFF